MDITDLSEEGFKMIIATGEALGPGGVRVEGFPHVEINTFI